MAIPSRPKSFSSEFEDRTDEHDEIHLWLADEENQKKVIMSTMMGHWRQSEHTTVEESTFQWHHYKETKTIGFREIQIVDYKPEKPIYGYNGFFLGVLDCLITFRACYDTVAIQFETDDDGKNKKESKTGIKGEQSDKFYLLCEFKPRIKKAGAAMAQTRV